MVKVTPSQLDNISGKRLSAAARGLNLPLLGSTKTAMSGWGFGEIRRSGLAAAFVAAALILFMPGQVLAQDTQTTRSLLPPQPPPPATFAPFTAPSAPAPGAGFAPGPAVPQSVAPQPLAPSPPPMPPQAAPSVMPVTPAVPAGRVALAVAARYGPAAPPINGGLIWRVYAAKPDATGVYRLIKEDHTAAPTFVLSPGAYVVHASVGLASAAKAVVLRSETVREVLDIPAGGVRLEGKVGDVRIPVGQISFEIFTGSQFDSGDRRPIAQNVMSGDVVLLPEGTYSIVSNYGDGNSVVRSDVHVDAGKLTDIVVTHRAAVITLKLVNNPGGEALANTQWTVLTPGGDVIKESIGAFPRIVLAEGDYHVIARNEGKTYQRDFKVITGVDGEVEVLAR
jgi:hypothetical protein